jgi:hypothetical protein
VNEEDGVGSISPKPSLFFSVTKRQAICRHFFSYNLAMLPEGGDYFPFGTILSDSQPSIS